MFRHEFSIHSAFWFLSRWLSLDLDLDLNLDLRSLGENLACISIRELEHNPGLSVCCAGLTLLSWYCKSFVSYHDIVKSFTNWSPGRLLFFFFFFFFLGGGGGVGGGGKGLGGSAWKNNWRVLVTCSCDGFLWRAVNYDKLKDKRWRMWSIVIRVLSVNKRRKKKRKWLTSRDYCTMHVINVIWTLVTVQLLWGITVWLVYEK